MPKRIWDVHFYAMEMEESISMWTLNFLPLILSTFINSPCHQMTLKIMGAEEKEESFSNKGTTCQKIMDALL